MFIYVLYIRIYVYICICAYVCKYTYIPVPLHRVIQSGREEGWYDLRSHTDGLVQVYACVRVCACVFVLLCMYVHILYIVS